MSDLIGRGQFKRVVVRGIGNHLDDWISVVDCVITTNIF
jgi:hypothetical protein